MRVELSRRADGGTTLRCTRSDGSVTWQNQPGRHAPFFALHDLTHFAVESQLGLSRAFYGLIASGWDIADTTGKGTRGPLPLDAIVAEHLVGALDQERASGSCWPASDFNDIVARVAEERGSDPRLRLTDVQLTAIRDRVADLSARWARLPPDGTMSLEFEPAAGAPGLDVAAGDDMRP